MRVTRRAAILGGLSTLASGKAFGRGRAPAPPQPRLIFNETFINQKTLDVNWTTNSPFGDGLYSNATWGEQQVYAGSSGGYGNPSPFTFGASGLTITASPIAAANQPALPADAYPTGYTGPNLACTYTSGCLSTLGLSDFTPPFYAEVSIKSTPVPGFWLTAEFFGDPMTGFPEIDVAQLATKRPTQSFPALLTATAGEVAGNFVTASRAPNLSAAFHTYGVEMLTTGTNWYVDRKSVMSSKQVVKGNLFFTINLAAGDTWDTTDSATDFIGPPSGQSGSITIGYIQVWTLRPF